MSTFGGLSTAWSGLTAARAGIDTVGQNIANVNTEGYTRQRVQTSSTATLIGMGPLDTQYRGGQGVSVDEIARLGNALIEARVRTTAASSGYAEAMSSTMDSIEAATNEPGDDGLAATLHSFWSSWQSVANNPTDSAASSVLLESAATLADRIANGYSAAAEQWTTTKSQAVSVVGQVNSLAEQVAKLNDQIRQVTASSSSPSELIDQRAQLTKELATLTGATTVDNPDGSTNVLIDGNLLVSGSTSRSLTVTGASRLEDANSSPVTVEWTHRPGDSAGVSSGKLGALVSALAPGTATSGGAITSAAESYNALATSLATTVNAVHSTGATSAGVTGLDFFAIDSSKPAALGLSVVPTDSTGIAAATPGAGGGSGGNADAISALGDSTTGPDTTWSDFVVRVGIATRRATDEATFTSNAATAAAESLQSESGVDLDQESMDLLTYQHAYQGAARVMTTIDEMLDVLINKTGLVGR